MAYVKQATESIIPFIEPGNLIILESTSPVNSTDEIIAKTLEDNGFNSDDVFIAHCPERVLPGKILKELVQNDRVIGGVTQKSAEKARDFYKLFVDGECFLTNARTAELAKLVENSYRDVNIAFANELSIIAEKFKIDVFELINLANKHPRVNILTPGPGVGGHCIAVDPWFIVNSSPEEANLIHQARLINDGKPEFVLNKVDEAVQKNPNARIACLGLAYKPDIDDLRESPSLHIAQVLSKRYPDKVYCVEPNIESFSGLSVEPLDHVLSKSDIIVILVST